MLRRKRNLTYLKIGREIITITDTNEHASYQ